MPIEINASPPPAAHLSTLAQMGYSFSTAVGDILDNSISAGATEVRIFLLKKNEGYRFYLVDNGSGMNEPDLYKNMVIGCQDPNLTRDKNDLGRFGAGLKTASFSQAKVLTVCSWQESQKKSAAVWDTELVRKENAWLLQGLEQDEISADEDLTDLPFSETGTLVRWSGLTMLETDTIDEALAAQAASIVNELHSYLGLHFHRFLGSNCKVEINGTVVEPIDPFMSKFNGYSEGAEQKVRSKAGTVFIKAHTLPILSSLSERDLRPYGGAKGVTEGQGLYIYRNRRLIVAGGWHGITPRSELGNLARIQIDIPATMDWEWDTDVKKSRLTIPPKVRAVLKTKLTPAVKRGSKKKHAYAGEAENVSDFWKVLVNEREGERSITYLLNPDAAKLEPIFAELSGKSVRQLVGFLHQASLELPVKHIYQAYAERPSGVQMADEIQQEITSLLEALND
jgi:hypothetical protein